MQLNLAADTTKLCLVCMMANDGPYTDLYDASSLKSGQSSLQEMLKAVCAPVFDASETDNLPGMPTKVCATCENAILAAFKLHQMCIETDRRLRELLAVKWELQDDDDTSGDPLDFNSKEGKREVLNMSVDEDVQDTACDAKSHVLKEEHPTREMEESVADRALEGSIKVEELDLMADDSDNGSGSDFEGEESSVEDTSNTTCKICSKSFGKVASLKLHITLKHKPFESQQERRSCNKRMVYACDYCEKTFRNDVNFSKHQADLHHNVTDAKRPFVCSLCEKSFVTVSELVTHKETHENPVECSCGRIFKNDKRLKIHADSGNCSGDNKSCNICNKTFKSADVMMAHRNNVHSDPVVCPECGQTLANPSSLRVHLRVGYCSVQPLTEAVLAAKTCKICGEVQKNHYAVKGHIIREHPDRMLRCDICSREFQAEKYLILHKKSHDTKTYRCQTCSETFFTKKALIQHRRIHRDPVKCNVCDKMYASKHSLATHMERHAGLKPFACDICPMRFISKVEIHGHMRTHTKTRDHVCEICGSGFTTKHSLKMHIKRAHEGYRPFPCTQCSLKFSDANRLKRHMHTHTGEKPYKCELCPQAYAQTNDLVKHVARAHGDGNPYLCDQCDESFRLLTDLRQHYRVHVQSTEGGAEQMEEVRFTSVAILKRAFAKAKQRQGNAE